MDEFARADDVAGAIGGARGVVEDGETLVARGGAAVGAAARGRAPRPTARRDVPKGGRAKAARRREEAAIEKIELLSSDSMGAAAAAQLD